MELKLISQTATYALIAMGFIANNSNGEPVLTRTIAEQAAIPQNFLSKILNRLVQAGLLKSTRGTNGGFTLTRPAHEIRMQEVVELFMNLDEFKRCFMGRPTCDGSCRIHSRWVPIADQFLNLLENTTIDNAL